MLRLKVDDHRAECRQSDSRREALDHPGNGQGRDAASDQKEHKRNRFEQDRSEQDRPPADVIGKRTEDEQGHKQSHHIYREDLGQNRVGKAPKVLVERVEGEGTAEIAGKVTAIAAIAQKARPWEIVFLGRRKPGEDMAK